jgi:hypothetical protein
MRRILVATAAAALALAPAAALAQDGEAEVVAVHGIPESVLTGLGAPDSEVDVYAEGAYDAPLVTFSFGDTGVLDVPAGDYTLEVYVAGQDPEAEDPTLTLGPANLAAGSSTSVVAHLDADGNPGLNAYANETDGTGIQVFHTAAFGPVDILSEGEVVLGGAANGDTARIDIPGGTTVPDVGVAPEGGEVALPLGDVEVPADTLVLAFAIGSPDDESLQVVTEAVAAQAADDGTDDGTDDGADGGTDDGAAADDGAATDGGETREGAASGGTTPVPSQVHAGSAGLATSSSLPALLLLAAGLVLLAAPVTAAVRSRR